MLSFDWCYIISHSFIFNVCVSIYLKWVPYRHHIVETCVSFTLNISFSCVFRTLTCKAIINIIRLMSVIFITGFYLLPLFFVPFLFFSFFMFHTFSAFGGFNWAFFIPFSLLSYHINSISIFFFLSGCPRVCNILKLLQVHFQINTVPFMGSSSTI